MLMILIVVVISQHISYVYQIIIVYLKYIQFLIFKYISIKKIKMNSISFFWSLPKQRQESYVYYKSQPFTVFSISESIQSTKNKCFPIKTPIWTARVTMNIMSI